MYPSIYPSIHLPFYLSIRRDKSAELRCTFCDVEFRWKKFFSAEVLGTNIESAEVHYTKREDEFRPNIGLNTKFRWKKNFQQKSATQSV